MKMVKNLFASLVAILSGIIASHVFTFMYVIFFTFISSFNYIFNVVIGNVFGGMILFFVYGAVFDKMSNNVSLMFHNINRWLFIVLFAMLGISNLLFKIFENHMYDNTSWTSILSATVYCMTVVILFFRDEKYFKGEIL